MINIIIYFQEISPLDIHIAEKYNIKYYGSKKNSGIIGGFYELLKRCNTEYFIFCENDFELVHDKLDTENILNDCLSLLNNYNVNKINLRDRIKYGEPLYSKPDGNANIMKYNIDYPYKIESLFYLTNPEIQFPNIFKIVDLNYNWYICDSIHQKWSNNVFISKTSWLKNNLLKLLEDNINNKESFLMEELLINNINNYVVSGGIGLFMHNRLDTANSKISNFFISRYNPLKEQILQFYDYLEDADILDIGSNIGLISLAICKYINYKSIHLFEPNIEYFSYSKYLLEDYKNIHYHNIGLSNCKEERILYSSNDDNIGWNTFLEKDPLQDNNFINNMNRSFCNIAKLDEYYRDIDNIDFIKIDVEGYEALIIEGALELIKKFRPYIYVEVGWGINHPNWSENYKIYKKLFNIGYKEIKFTDKTEDILFIPYQINLIHSSITESS
jgi:FkbM family methyltransferase